MGVGGRAGGGGGGRGHRGLYWFGGPETPSLPLPACIVTSSQSSASQDHSLTPVVVITHQDRYLEWASGGANCPPLPQIPTLPPEGGFWDSLYIIVLKKHRRGSVPYCARNWLQTCFVGQFKRVPSHHNRVRWETGRFVPVWMTRIE